MTKQITVTEYEIRGTLVGIQVWGYQTRKELSDISWFDKKYSPSMLDRKIRKCISVLQERGEPIIAFPGGGYGYMPDDDPKAAVEYCNKLYRRINTEMAKADNIYCMLKRKYGAEVASQVDQPALVNFDEL